MNLGRVKSYIIAVALSAAVLGHVPTLVMADGTETLGPPSIPIAPGTGLVAAGTGLINAQPQDIDFNVPLGATVNQVILYWGDRYDDGGTIDDTALVNGIPVTGALIGGPTPPSASGFVTIAYRADITGLGLVGPGANTLSIGGLDFIDPGAVDSQTDGAGVFVIFDDGGAASAIEVRDGADYANAGLHPGDPILGEIVPQTFVFPPDAVDRDGSLSIFVGDADDGRSDTVNIFVDGALAAQFINQLEDGDGPRWDTLIVPFTVPAGATTVTAEIISGPFGPGGSPDSLFWVGAGLTIEQPLMPGIDIRKQAEGPDTRTFPTGSDVTFEIEVTNTGETDLDNVVVTDFLAPQCDNVIGFLAQGDSVTYECTVPMVVAGFVNEACVAGEFGGSVVEDCDPSTVEIIDIDIRKQAEGPDSRNFPPGSDVTFEIVVTNTGEEDLENVVVTDALAPQCDRNIGDLAAGASFSYTCTVPNVTTGFENEACVEGQRNGVVVDDCDPSTVVIQDLITRTLGYWKNHPTVINGSFDGPGGFPSLLPLEFCGESIVSPCDAIEFLGSKGGGINNFKRQGMAALLNCQAFGCPGKIFDLIQAGSEACANGDDFPFGSAGSALDIYNNSGDDAPLPFQSPPAQPMFCELISLPPIDGF